MKQGSPTVVENHDEELNKIFGQKKLIMGFGHRVYKNGDPRNAIIKVSRSSS